MDDYDCADVKNYGSEMFRRHTFCNCIVEYSPVRGSKSQNVHMEKWRVAVELDRFQREDILMGMDNRVNA